MSVEIQINHRRGTATPGSSLFDCAEALGVQVPTSCRKQGKCKECMVEVVEGQQHLSARTPAERHLTGNFRLSCSCQIVGTNGFVNCHTLRRGEMRIERHGFHLPTKAKQVTPDPAVTRSGDRILLDGQEIDRGTGPIHGLAVDLGTTTVVLRLLNLETGEVIADASFENPQRFGGSDVMSRIHYDTNDASHVLQKTLAGYLRHAIEELPADPKSIYEVVIAGNSTMRDMFFRLDVYSIGQSPYQSITELDLARGTRTTTSIAESAGRLGLPLNPKARVYGLPIISGHVGADAAACMLAIDLPNEERLVAIMDIGTNTELIVGNRHKIFAASCPAGPAFEGGSIACGMPGLPGAIEKVRIDESGQPHVDVIGGGMAEGLCGSGLVDLLGELLRTGQINNLGRFQQGQEQFTLSATDSAKVYFTEGDINELAQAKGANVAGLHVVFDRYGIRFDDLGVFYLAGGFGRHLSLASSKRIGLIPNLDDSKIVQIGNASIEGACTALLSVTKRAELEQLVRGVTHCRLETHPDFFDYFVEGCQFGPLETLNKLAS